MISQSKNELWRFLLALQFMTRLPAAPRAAYSRQRFSESVRHYPLVGLLIGAIATAIFWALTQFFPDLLAILISTAAVMLLTGAFHEDGLADTFDGIGGGLCAERSLEIMKDSRIGVYGMVALLMVLSTKVAALSAMYATLIFISLPAAHCMSRWSSVVVIASSNYVRDEGTGKPTAEGIGKAAMLYSSIIGLGPLAVLYFLCSPVIAAGAASGLVIAHVLIRWFYQRKIGGYTGDCLGAVQQVSEVGVYLGILACL